MLVGGCGRERRGLIGRIRSFSLGFCEFSNAAFLVPGTAVDLNGHRFCRRKNRNAKAIRSLFDAQVSRAEALLLNLEQERERWSLSSESFTKQLQSLIGDGLLAAAFITYVGVFDYRTRKVSKHTCVVTCMARMCFVVFGIFS